MGTIGMGAGLIAVPLLILTGMNIKQVIATIMVMQLLPQLAGVINYKEHINWTPTIIVIIGSLFGIWLGSHLVIYGYVTERMIYQILTVFLFVSSIYFYKEHW
jgi:uncharacterized membrane protein YfcA